MPEYKLYHFNIRFLAEPIRLIFAYANVPFEDIRVSVDDWKIIKKKSPWGQLPMLELPDGRTLGHSNTIAAFLAKRFDLVGRDEFDLVKCSEIADSLRDMRQEWRKVFFQKNRDRKCSANKAFIDETIPKYFQRISEMQEETDGIFLVGNRMTYADLLFAHNAEFFEETIQGDLFAQFPRLRELKIAVYKIPRINQYLDNRSKADLSLLNVIQISD